MVLTSFLRLFTGDGPNKPQSVDDNISGKPDYDSGKPDYNQFGGRDLYEANGYDDDYNYGFNFDEDDSGTNYNYKDNYGSNYNDDYFTEDVEISKGVYFGLGVKKGKVHFYSNGKEIMVDKVVNDGLEHEVVLKKENKIVKLSVDGIEAEDSFEHFVDEAFMRDLESHDIFLGGLSENDIDYATYNLFTKAFTGCVFMLEARNKPMVAGMWSIKDFQMQMLK